MMKGDSSPARNSMKPKIPRKVRVTIWCWAAQWGDLTSAALLSYQFFCLVAKPFDDMRHSRRKNPTMLVTFMLILAEWKANRKQQRATFNFFSLRAETRKTKWGKIERIVEWRCELIGSPQIALTLHREVSSNLFVCAPLELAFDVDSISKSRSWMPSRVRHKNGNFILLRRMAVARMCMKQERDVCWCDAIWRNC